ncbi:MAG: hypothetical protein ABSG62_02735 [Terracidiphilus sp.]|jgi:hypothetical protein
MDRCLDPGVAARDEKGETMVVVPLLQPENESKAERRTCGAECTNWARIAAGGSLLAGGVLLLTGRHRAGLAVAATGTTLALLDQQEVLRAWWDALPSYIEDALHLLDRVQASVEELSAQSERLHRALSR